MIFLLQCSKMRWRKYVQARPNLQNNFPQFFSCVFFLPGHMFRMKDADWQEFIAGLQERMGDSRPEGRNSAFALPWWEVDKEKKEGKWIKRSLSEKIFRMKNETNLGCKPGQMRYDSVLKVLTALKRFSQSLVTPPNEYMNKMDHICSEKFCIEQEQLFRGVGNYRRQSVLNKRVAASRTPRETPLQTQIKNEQEEVGEDLKNDTNRESRTGKAFRSHCF